MDEFVFVWLLIGVALVLLPGLVYCCYDYAVRRGKRAALAHMLAQADSDMEKYARKWEDATDGQKAPAELVRLTMPSSGGLGLTTWRCATSIVVTKVDPGSVASESGFRPFDVIVKINLVGDKINAVGASAADAGALLARLVPGQDIVITKSFYADGAGNKDDTLLEIVKAAEKAVALTAAAAVEAEGLGRSPRCAKPFLYS